MDTPGYAEECKTKPPECTVCQCLCFHFASDNFEQVAPGMLTIQIFKSQAIEGTATTFTADEAAQHVVDGA